jgi:CheY-like chemotaxis protein
MIKPTIILVVDDNPSMAHTLADILKVKGFEVYAAISGKTALEVLRTHPVDILLTDVKMPDMDGVTLYRQTRNLYPRLVTFLMTAYAADELIQKGMSEGIKTVLTKPLDIDFIITLFSAYRNLWTSDQ